MKLSLSILMLSLLMFNSGLFGQQVPDNILKRISSDFKTGSESKWNKRMKHIQLIKEENEEVGFYIDSLDVGLFFNNKTKSEVFEWLGPPDSTLLIDNKVDYHLYNISPLNRGCFSHFSFGIPRPVPKSYLEPKRGDVISIEFVCLRNCDNSNQINDINELTIKYLKISFKN